MTVVAAAVATPAAYREPSPKSNIVASQIFPNAGGGGFNKQLEQTARPVCGDLTPVGHRQRH